MYVLMCSGEFVTFPSPKESHPHLEATVIDDDGQRFVKKGPSARRHTEDLVPHVVLLDEISQELFINTGSIDNLLVLARTLKGMILAKTCRRVPERAT
jgi:hypothetical protein